MKMHFRILGDLAGKIPQKIFENFSPFAQVFWFVFQEVRGRSSPKRFEILHYSDAVGGGDRRESLHDFLMSEKIEVGFDQKYFVA